VKFGYTMINVWVMYERPESVDTLFFGRERRLVREEVNYLELPSSYTISKSLDSDWLETTCTVGWKTLKFPQGLRLQCEYDLGVMSRTKCVLVSNHLPKRLQRLYPFLYYDAIMDMMPHC
jgi:hypothetical protein